ncbi:MAG TPA: YidB family protein [Xanthobacteraceae bacterium]|nr:YidB family protein [Xanthobacteraceae bacterium]
MGLMDILNGMQNGPGGQRQPAPPGSGSSGGGMSPMMMALLGMLAYKAIKGGGLGNILGGGGSAPAAPAPGRVPGATHADSSGGGLGDILGGLGGMLGGATAGQSVPGGLGSILGGLLGGGAAGNVLNGGLKNLLGDMEENGEADAANSWVSNGPNKQISPGDLGKALGADDVNAVAQQTGMSRDDLLKTLSQHLPDLVNQMTPNGRLPSDHEASRW